MAKVLKWGGPGHVSIWENRGVNGTFRVASFELRYNKDEQWQTSHSYGASDLKFLENAAKQARRRIESRLRTSGARHGLYDLCGAPTTTVKTITMMLAAASILPFISTSMPLVSRDSLLPHRHFSACLMP